MVETISAELFAAAADRTRLNERSVALARLRLVDGMSYRQIRDKTGATYGVVREKEMKIIYHARAILAGK